MQISITAVVLIPKQHATNTQIAPMRNPVSFPGKRVGNYTEAEREFYRGGNRRSDFFPSFRWACIGLLEFIVRRVFIYLLSRP